MGTQEKESRTRLRRNQLQHIVLGTVAVAGVVGVALLIPQVLVAMKKLNLLPSPRQGTVIGSAITRLIQKGLLVREGGRLRLTQSGQLQLHRASVALSTTARRRWDGRWRVIVFDVPERRRMVRDKMRYMLRTIGFKRIQDSVWVFPYDCEDVIVLLKADAHIGKDVLYMIVDSLEGDTELRRHFKLRKA